MQRFSEWYWKLKAWLYELQMWIWIKTNRIPGEVVEEAEYRHIDLRSDEGP